MLSHGKTVLNDKEQNNRLKQWHMNIASEATGYLQNALNYRDPVLHLKNPIYLLKTTICCQLCILGSSYTDKLPSENGLPKSKLAREQLLKSRRENQNKQIKYIYLIWATLQRRPWKPTPSWNRCNLQAQNRLLKQVLSLSFKLGVPFLQKVSLYYHQGDQNSL